jgi:hypothetical protein
MATTKNESFKNLTEYLKKLKELDDTAVKNNSIIDELKSSTIFSAAGNKEPTTKVEEKSTPASLNKFNEKFLKNQEDKDKIFSEINDNLKDIKKALKGDTPDKKVGGGPGRSDTSPGALPKADNLTFTEKLKSAVAGVKGAGNKVMGLGEKVVGATTGTVESLISDPKGFAKKAFGSLKGSLTGAVTSVTKKADSVGKYVKDVVSTKADYTPEQERFADVMSHTKGNTLMQGKKSAKELAGETFNKIQSKQKEINEYKADSQKKIDEQRGIMQKFKDQGFEPRKKDTDKLASLEKNRDKNLANLEKELAAVDPRVKKDDTDKREAKVESKQERDVSEQALAASNPNADNVESSSEKISKEIADNNKTISSLLAVATSQLTSLNAIKDALAPSNPKEQEAKGQKPREPEVAPAPAAEGGSMLGDIASTASDFLGKGKGLGGKVLGGLGKAAKFLGPAAAVAGAAYSGFQGYQNANENFDLKQGEEATTGQKVSSTLGGVASGLTFGLLDEKSASQGIHKAGSAVKDFFGFGDKKQTGDSKVTESGGSDKARLAAKEQYQIGTKEEDAAKQKREAFEKDNPFDYRDKPTKTQTFLELPGDGKFSNPEKQKEYNSLRDAEIEAFSKKSKAREDYEKADKAQRYITTPGGQTLINAGAEFKKKDALTGRFGYKDTDLLNEDGQSYSMGKINKAYDTKVKEDLLSPLPGLNGNQRPATLGEVNAVKDEQRGATVAKTSTENKDMERDAIKGTGGNNTIVSNNVSSNNTTKYVPMKASPRPESQGSALDRYQNRITTF